MQKQITKYLLIALILSLGFGQLLRFDLYGVPLYLHDLLVVLLLALQGPTLKEVPNHAIKANSGEGRTLKLGLKFIVFGLSLGWLRALTLFPLGSLLVPFLYTLRLLSYLALYFALKNSQIQVNRSYFFISAFVSLCIGLLQYFLLPDMRVFQYLGWDDHLSRLILPHFDPTFTGVMLVLGFLFAIQSKTNLWRLASIIYLPAILLTYSRSVWLSLALTATLFIKNKYVLLASIILLLVSIFALPRKFGEGTNLLRTFSIESRFSSDLTIIKDLNWNLLPGVGLNTFALNTTSVKGYPNHATGPNNSYLYILATCGIMGLIGWGIFLKNLYQHSLFRPAIIFILISSLFNNVLFSPFVILWIFLIDSMDPSAT
jgi:hypothetical protein